MQMPHQSQGASLSGVKQVANLRARAALAGALLVVLPDEESEPLLLTYGPVTRRFGVDRLGELECAVAVLEGS